jgi:hypothetical protein
VRRPAACGLVHAEAEAIAGDARLADFEERRRSVAIADADVVVGESFDGEVLTELPLGEVVSSE